MGGYKSCCVGANATCGCEGGARSRLAESSAEGGAVGTEGPLCSIW